jgi:hypothetical protein
MGVASNLKLLFHNIQLTYPQTSNFYFTTFNLRTHKPQASISQHSTYVPTNLKLLLIDFSSCVSQVTTYISIDPLYFLLSFRKLEVCGYVSWKLWNRSLRFVDTYVECCEIEVWGLWVRKLKWLETHRRKSLSELSVLIWHAGKQSFFNFNFNSLFI